MPREVFPCLPPFERWHAWTPIAIWRRMKTKCLKLAIRILVTSGLLVWVLSQVDHQELWQAVRAARPLDLVVLWVTSLAFFALRSFKLRLILKRQALDVPTLLLFKVSTVNSLYSFVLPGFMSTGIKWYILKKATRKGTNIFNGMLYNQLSEIITMSVCALFTLIVTNPTPILLPETKHLWMLPTTCSILLVVLIALPLFLLSRRTNRSIAAILDHVLRWLPERMRDKGLQALREAATFQSAGWPFHILMGLLTVVTQVGATVVVYVLAARAAHFSIPLIVYVWLTSVIYILGRIPVTFANLGVREIALVNILAIYGVERSSALLMSMIIFSSMVVKAALGAVFLIHWSLTGRNAERGAQSQPDRATR